MKTILLLVALYGITIASVQRQSDGSFLVTQQDGSTVSVPNDPANAAAQQVAAWVRAGNTPLPVATPRPYYDPVEAIQIRLKLSAIASEITSATTGVASLQAYQRALQARLVILRSLPLLPAYTVNPTPTNL